MLFLAFSKVEVDFAKKKFTKKAYTITKALFIIKKVYIINSKECIKLRAKSFCSIRYYSLYKTNESASRPQSSDCFFNY